MQMIAVIFFENTSNFSVIYLFYLIFYHQKE